MCKKFNISTNIKPVENSRLHFIQNIFKYLPPFFKITVSKEYMNSVAIEKIMEKTREENVNIFIQLNSSSILYGSNVFIENKYNKIATEKNSNKKRFKTNLRFLGL